MIFTSAAVDLGSLNGFLSVRSHRRHSHGGQALAHWCPRPNVPAEAFRAGKTFGRFAFGGLLVDLIIEHDRAQPFTALPNSILRDDTRLTWKAKAIYAYLLGCPPGWVLRMADLVARSRDGRDAVLGGLAELEQHGYIRRVQTKDTAGRFSTTRIMVSVPSLVYGRTAPQPGKPLTENPYTENPRHTKKEHTKKDDTNIEPGSAGVSQDMLFADGEGTLEHFLQTFPAEWNAMAVSGAVAIVGNPPSLNPRRATMARRAWKTSEQFRAHWRDAVKAIPTMPNYTGKNRSGWRIDVTHFLRPGIVEEILERSKNTRNTSTFSREEGKGFTI